MKYAIITEPLKYLQRQCKLRGFVQLLKSILSDKNLATDRMPNNIFFEKVKEVYFSKNNYLQNKENKFLFPRATNQFINSINNGHTIDSMKNDLNFLETEFNDYFNDLKDKKVLIPNKDNPSAYRLNHNSAMVYWIIGVGVIFSFLWKLFEIFSSKS